MTYTATVAVEQPLRALMSAQTVEPGADTKQSRFSDKLEGPITCYHFKQDIPVPSYLLALAVGEVQSQTVGPRSRVWAEPPVLKAAAWEFAETEQYLEAGGSPLRLLQSSCQVANPMNLTMHCQPHRCASTKGLQKSALSRCSP